MRKFLISVPVSAMIGKQGKNFTTAKIFKKVCKTLFVTGTSFPIQIFNTFAILLDLRDVTSSRRR